jgi:hypothetical protein
MCYNENPPELHTQSYLEAHVDSLTNGVVKPAVDSIEAVSGLAQGLLCYFEELRGSYRRGPPQPREQCADTSRDDASEHIR